MEKEKRITGKQVMDQYGIEHFTLFEWMKDGLPFESDPVSEKYVRLSDLDFLFLKPGGQNARSTHYLDTQARDKHLGYLYDNIEKVLFLKEHVESCAQDHGLTMRKTDRGFMEMAIAEAAKCDAEDARIHPMVGAAVVKDGKLLAAGHRGELSRGEHAEYTVLERKLKDQIVAGSTIYTTLEPCTTRNHPKIPCAERLIDRKVSRVVIGMLDPDERIRGKGQMRLREANIITDFFSADLMAQVEEINRAFIREKKKALERREDEAAIPLTGQTPRVGSHDAAAQIVHPVEEGLLKEPARKRVREHLSAVIVTALDVEYKAICAHLSDLREETLPQGNVYGVGSFSCREHTWQVVVVETSKGNVKAGLQTDRAIFRFNPSVVIFVGIAGGIKDVRLGDVVVANKVYAYESGKAVSTFETRPEVGIPGFRPLERAKAEARKDDWLRRIGTVRSSPPHVHIGPIACGAKVLASKKAATFKLIKSNYSDSLAVDMEDYGFLEASYANPGVDALAIRGISDLISGKATTDKLQWQEKAAENASAFAFEVLSKLSYAPTTVPRQDEKNDEPLIPVGGGIGERCKAILSKITSTEKQDTYSLLIDVESDCSEGEQYFLVKFLLREIERLDPSARQLLAIERKQRILNVVYRLLDREILVSRSWPLFLDQLDQDPRNYLSNEFFRKYQKVIDKLTDGELDRFTNILVKAWKLSLGNYDIENVLAEITDRYWDRMGAGQKKTILSVFFEIVCSDRKENYAQKRVAGKTIERLERENRDSLINEVFGWIKEKIREEYEAHRETMETTGRIRSRNIADDAEFFASSHDEIRKLLKIDNTTWGKEVLDIYSDIWSSKPK